MATLLTPDQQRLVRTHFQFMIQSVCHALYDDERTTPDTARALTPSVLIALSHRINQLLLDPSIVSTCLVDRMLPPLGADHPAGAAPNGSEAST